MTPTRIMVVLVAEEEWTVWTYFLRISLVSDVRGFAPIHSRALTRLVKRRIQRRAGSVREGQTFACRSKDVASALGNQYAPSPQKAAAGVATRIFTSSN